MNLSNFRKIRYQNHFPFHLPHPWVVHWIVFQNKQTLVIAFLIANNSRTTEHSLIHQNWPQIFCLNCLTNPRILVFTCLMLGWTDLIHFNIRISTFHRVPLENIMCTVQNLYCVEWYQQYIRKLLCCRLSVQQTDADEWADGVDW